jgi:hypothetical protein
MSNAIQRLRAKQIVRAVGHFGHHHGWGWRRTRRCMVLALMCAATEANWFVYANRYNTESQKLEHDAMGWDHDSVGLFQQRVPMWGTTEECMAPDSSTRKFLHSLVSRGLSEYKKPGWSLAERVQAVQVSAPGETDYDGDGRMDGLNYRASLGRARRFFITHPVLARRAWRGDPIKSVPGYPNQG